MEGKVCVVTGATSGIGREIARTLASMGARVVIVGRDRERAERAVVVVGGRAEVALADLSSRRQVATLAAELLERCPRIDVLVHDAGVYRMRRTTTEDGLEETFAVNHLAPFLLTSLLRERLRASAPARVVTVASEAHRGARLDFDDLQLERGYGAWRAYTRSKLANVMFTYALARRLGDGVTANCMHPGFVATNLGSSRLLRWSPLRLARPFLRSPRRGADTAVWLASSPDVEGVGGGYFDDRSERPSSPTSYDTDAQERLWRASAELTRSE